MTRSSVKNKSAGEASSTTASTSDAVAGARTPKHCFVCRTKVGSPLWQGSPSKLLAALTAMEPRKLPDCDRLYELAQRRLQRVSFCKRHLQFLDGTSAEVDVSSPTAVRRKRRSSAIKEARAANAQAEAAKKERALILKAKRELESCPDRLPVRGRLEEASCSAEAHCERNGDFRRQNWRFRSPRTYLEARVGPAPRSRGSCQQRHAQLLLLLSEPLGAGGVRQPVQCQAWPDAASPKDTAQCTSRSCAFVAGCP
mmetsp:Transcript_21011/g.81177  ORF Transcript_21011/g.81177 Transcript_21011/m.81177 type:complete len:255 (-) Transcript_21011:1621-2385(-)